MYIYIYIYTFIGSGLSPAWGPLASPDSPACLRMWRSDALPKVIFMYTYIYIYIYVYIYNMYVYIYIYIYIYLVRHGNVLMFFLNGFHRRESRSPVAAGSHKQPTTETINKRALPRRKP